MALSLSGVGAAWADTATPVPTTITGSVVVNADGTASVTVTGTWTWDGQTCAGQYGEAWSVDWWGVSTSPTPDHSFSLSDASAVTSPGVTTIGNTVSPAGSLALSGDSSKQYFHVGAYYAGEDVNSQPGACQNAGGSSTGTFKATATYPSVSDIPAEISVNLYGEHCGGKTDFSPSGNSCNSVQTCQYNQSGGCCYCWKPPVPSTGTLAGHIYRCTNGAPTTTEVGGGTLSASGPQAVGPTANPLGPLTVPAGHYTMDAGAPPGETFVQCGGSATIGTPATTASQSVVVPSGGNGTGVFYVDPVPSSQPPSSISVEVTKTNDASESGSYAQTETAAEPDDTVPFKVVVTNTSAVAVTVESLTDSWPGQSPFSPTCAEAVVGTTLVPAQSATCAFSVAGYGPLMSASVTDTAHVSACQVGVAGNCGDGDATSTVIVPSSSMNSSLSLGVSKANDADGSETYAQTETAGSTGQTVDFQVTVVNTSSVSVTITSLTDSWPGQVPFSPGCAAALVGTTLAAGQSTTCDFAVAGYAPAYGSSRTDTVTVDACQASNGSVCGSWAATSTVVTGPAISSSTSTTSSSSVPTATAPTGPRTAPLAFTGAPARLRLLLWGGLMLVGGGALFLLASRLMRRRATGWR